METCRWGILFRWAATLTVMSIPVRAADPFAVAVIAYEPAPGQFVNDPRFNDPRRALGPPQGGGTDAADNSSVVTLGGFGGTLVLAFDHTVEDDPLNPFGLDAVVFGNAFWAVGAGGLPDPNRHWAECATIEIARDLNGNGRPDEEEPWYLIRGSHLADPAAHRLVATWDDDTDDDTYPPPFSSWIPSGRIGLWTTQAYALPVELFGSPVVLNPSPDRGREGIFGYADYSPTLLLGDLDADGVVDDPDMPPEEFYTVPDDPFTVGITPGAGGGDAFDIAWAVDPRTGEPAGLTGFDFIRLTTAVYVVDAGFGLGEKSAEIDAVADVRPDPCGDGDGDQDIDLTDVAGMQRCFGTFVSGGDACGAFDCRVADAVVALDDVRRMLNRMTGPR